MLKKIILTIFFMFVLISPISANTTIYDVPWTSDLEYFIVMNGLNNPLTVPRTGTQANWNVLDENIPIAFVATSLKHMNGYIQLGGPTMAIYFYKNNTWTKLNGILGSQVDIPGYIRFWSSDSPNRYRFNNITYSSHDVFDHATNTLLFPQAPFQLPVTPEQLREGATLESLNQLIQRISMDLLQILPIGLLVLSSLLVIHLLKRLLYWGIR